MRTFLLSFCFLFFAFAICFSQLEKQTVKEIVAQIAENNFYCYPPDGFNSIDTSVQYSLAVDLAEVATTKELVKLTQHENGVVRAYAFDVLDNQNYPKLLSLAVKHIDDTLKIKTYSFHTIYLSVGEFFVCANHLSPEDRQKLDDILLNSNNTLRYTNHVLNDLEPTEKNYKRIRELAKTNQFAVIALSKYRKQEDIELIQAQLLTDHYFSIEAIEHFPDPAFKATLTELRRQGYGYAGTEASVAVYQDAFSTAYFNGTLDQLANQDYNRKQEAKSIFEAIQKYPNPVYDSLLFRLWGDDITDEATFEYLLTVDGSKCKALILQSLKRLNGLDNNSYSITTFLNYLIEVDPETATTLVADKIRNHHVFKYEYFPKAAEQLYSDTIVAALLERLEKADNPYVYLPIVEALVSYKQSRVNERMFAVIKANPAIDGWGEEKMDKFLVSKGLMVH